MKKKNIKKRLAALRSGLMLSLCVISPFSVFKAANFNVIVTNEYGSFTRGNWSASILNTTYSTSAVIGELNGVYNGRVTINYSTDPTTQNLLFIPINCSMESTSGNSITIIFKNVSSFMVLIDGSGADSLQVNSMTGWNMTKLTDGTNTQLNSVISYIDNIETLLTTNNTTLGLIYNYIQTLDTSNTDISIDVGDIQVDVNDIEVGIGDLLSAITSMITDGIDTITLGDLLDELEQTNTYLSNIDLKLTSIQGYLHTAVTHLYNIYTNSTQINSNVNTINTNIVAAKNDIADIKTYVNNIVTTLNNINNSISNVDNMIDNITWLKWTESTGNMEYSIDGITYQTGSGNRSSNTYFKVGNYNSYLNNDNDKNNLYKLYLPIGGFSSYPKIEYFEFYTLNSSGNYTRFYVNNTYLQYVRTAIYIYFDLYDNTSAFNEPNGSNLQFIVKYKNMCYQYAQKAKLEYITANDIEYWTLLNSITTYNYRIELINKLNTLTPYNYNSKLDSILNAINNLEINYNISTDIQNDIDVSVDAINDIDTVINNEINIFNQNKDLIFNSFDNLPDFSQFKLFLKNNIFIGRFGQLYTYFITGMLFITFVLVLLG